MKHISPSKNGISRNITPELRKKTAAFLDKGEIKSIIENIYSSEYDDMLQFILNISESDFIKKVQSRVNLVLNEFRISIHDKQVQEILVTQKEKLNDRLVATKKQCSKFLFDIKKSSNISNDLLYFARKHCKNTQKIPLHTCKAKLLIIRDKNNAIIYILCSSCKMLYYPNLLELYCESCDDDYPSQVVSNDIECQMQPATWDRYHCGVRNPFTSKHEQMKCPNCKSGLFLRVIDQILICKKCQIATDALNIEWSCTTCKNPFKSRAKIFNQLPESKWRSAVKDSLILKQLAFPDMLCICSEKSYYQHNSNCEGELYFVIGEIMSVVCGLCKDAFFTNNHTWICGLCQNSFKIEKNPKNMSFKVNLSEFKTEENYNQNSDFQESNPRSRPRLQVSQSEVRGKSTSPRKKQEINDSPTNKKQVFFSPHKIAHQNSAIQVNHYNKSGNISDRLNTVEANDRLSPLPSLKKSSASTNTNNETFNSPLKDSSAAFELEDYTIIKEIGEGSFGLIFMCENNQTHEKFALKKIISKSKDDLGVLKREYEILMKFPHPNILKLHGVCAKMLDFSTRVFYILMELANSDLENEIKKRANYKKHFTESELILILKNTVSALSFLQEKGISHRDIKPQNILVYIINNSLLFKIADFGEAKNKFEQRNDVETLKGTELYMSPALFNTLRKGLGENLVHNVYKSDVFSLGYVLLYSASLNVKILYGIRTLFSRAEVEKSVKKFLNGSIYSDKFIDLMCKMVETDENKRPDFIELREILNDEF